MEETNQENSPRADKTLRIVLLTQWYDPEPTLKGIQIAHKLTARGFDVEVVTRYPNYPGGSIYEGYRFRPHQREVADGIRVSRVFL